MDIPQFSYEFVKRAIMMSMDRGDKERESVSKLISECYPDILSTNVIGKGFERLFEVMEELEKDVPAASDVTATFIARCVIDECLPPSFLSDAVICSLGGDIIDKAKRMLSREHMGAVRIHSSFVSVVIYLFIYLFFAGFIYFAAYSAWRELGDRVTGVL